MKKEEIKEFAKKHEKELKIGAWLVLFGLGTFTVGRFTAMNSDKYSQLVIDTINKRDDNAKRFVEFIKSCEEVKNGASHYLPFDATEFAKLTGKEIVTDGNGTLCKVVGGMIFGNPVGSIVEF